MLVSIFQRLQLNFESTMIKLGVIIGITAAGVVIVCGICILLIRLALRKKHKHRMTQIATVIEETLSRVPSSHMHISSEDVARMPGTNFTMRNSLQNRHNCTLYNQTLSCDPPKPRAPPRTMEKANSSTDLGHEAVTPLQSWPLPRRLTRSDGTPLANPPISSTSPKKRKEDKRPSSLRVNEKEPERSLENSARPTSLDIIQNRFDNNISPNARLKPRPLFYGQRRSVSHSIISQSKNAMSPPSTDSKARALPGLRHPRSMSVCSQKSGAPPTHVLPPLPFESAQTRNKDTNLEGLFSDDTPISNDEKSKVLSQGKTDLHLVDLR